MDHPLSAQTHSRFGSTAQRSNTIEIQQGGAQLLIGEDRDGIEIEFVLVEDRNAGGWICIHAAPAEWRRR